MIPSPAPCRPLRPPEEGGAGSVRRVPCRPIVVAPVPSATGIAWAGVPQLRSFRSNPRPPRGPAGSHRPDPTRSGPFRPVPTGRAGVTAPGAAAL